MIKIYVRHAEKRYMNGFSKKYKFDPPIMESSIDDILKLGERLIKEYGKPDVILCSPYKRTRETAYFLKSCIEGPIDIYCDVTLSEYLGNHKECEMDVCPETLVHKPPHPEKFGEFCNRVRKHCNKISQLKCKSKNPVVWIITHGIVIKQVYYLHGIKKKQQINNLDGVVISKDFFKPL